MKRRIGSIIPILTLALLLQPAASVSSRAEQISDELSDSAALTIRVISGVPGSETGETAAVFTIEELIERSFCEDDYTLIDRDNGVIIDHAMGASLRELLSEAGIDTVAIEELVFRSDKTQLTLSASDLLETDRYCYYSLPDHYTDDSYLTDPAVTLFCAKVETILAVQDHWMPVSEGGMFWSNPAEMTDENAVRLVFGQADISEQKADTALSGIHTIEVVLHRPATFISDLSQTGELSDPPAENSEMNDVTEPQTEDPPVFVIQTEPAPIENVPLLDVWDRGTVLQPDITVSPEPEKRTVSQNVYSVLQEPTPNTVFTIQTDVGNLPEGLPLLEQTIESTDSAAVSRQAVNSPVRNQSVSVGRVRSQREVSKTPVGTILPSEDKVLPDAEASEDSDGAEPKRRVYELNLNDAGDQRQQIDNTAVGQNWLSRIFVMLVMLALPTGAGFLFFHREKRKQLRKI